MYLVDQKQQILIVKCTEKTGQKTRENAKTTGLVIA